MNKTTCKILVLLLVSLFLLFNLSFLNVNTLSLAKKSASDSKESMVKESKVRVPQEETLKDTSSKVVATKAETTKEVLTSEAKDVEEIVVQGKDVLEKVTEPEVVTVEEKADPEDIAVPVEEQEVDVQAVEELVVPAEEQKAEEPVVEELAIEVPAPKTLEVTEPEVVTVEEKAEAEELAVPVEETDAPIVEELEVLTEEQEADVPVAEESADTTVPHGPFRPDEWTKMTSDGTDQKITVSYQGHYCYVSFAKFKCNLTMCDGFNGSAEQIEARRGGCTVGINAPAAKDGYVFKEWKKIGKELVQGTESSYYEVYEAIYEKTAEETDKDKVSTLLEQPVVEVAEATEVVEASKVAEVKPVEKDHTCYRPENDEWTKISDYNSATITLTFGGCYSYVSFAQFVCDINMCEGFNGATQKYVARRGESTETITAPTAKQGFKFDHWTKEKKVDEKTGITIDTYRAVYVEDK